jgi:hypothetical protein
MTSRTVVLMFFPNALKKPVDCVTTDALRLVQRGAGLKRLERCKTYRFGIQKTRNLSDGKVGTSTERPL